MKMKVTNYSQQADERCTACNGSGYYDSCDSRGRSIACGSCEGTGLDDQRVLLDDLSLRVSINLNSERRRSFSVDLSSKEAAVLADYDREGVYLLVDDDLVRVRDLSGPGWMVDDFDQRGDHCYLSAVRDAYYA